MKTIIWAVAFIAVCVECRYSPLERQWNEYDARQNCTTKCTIECENCKNVTTCNENEFKCGAEPPEVGPDCPPNDICVPSGCECETVGSDGKKCPLICPPNCPDHEIECDGEELPNGCKENNYCHPKGTGNDGAICPGFCPEDCEDNEMRCPEPNDPSTGCEVQPSCVEKQVDNQGKFCSHQQCPLRCNATEQLCHGSVDYMRCKEEDKCIPKGISDSGELCPGTCPVECEPEEILCPGQVDYNEGPTYGCVGQDECKPRAKDMNGDYCPDESASHDCPVTCPPDEVLCPPGDGPLECKLAAECVTKSQGNDGTDCPTTSDCPTHCNEHEVNCPGGTDDNGCKNPDICVEEMRNTEGDLCPVHCPIECEVNEVLCTGQRNVFGCLEADHCVTRPIKDRGTDEGGLCPGWCPPKCKHNEILCPSQIDPCDGCPTEEVCVVAQTDVNDVFCPGKDYPNEPLSASHGCPRICDNLQGYSLCPVSEDDTGCKPQEECRLKDLDNNNQWCNEWSNCPIQCKDDEIVCHDGKDPRGCNYPDFCLSRGQDKDGNLCDKFCPTQCDEPRQMFCNGGILPNGCYAADTCVDRTTDNNGHLCPGVCPPSCPPGEVIKTNLPMTDDTGCPIAVYKCVPGTNFEIQCDSDNDDYTCCAAGAQVVDVTLKQQDSSTACVKGENFDFNGTNICVDNGCSGKFDVTLRTTTPTEYSIETEFTVAGINPNNFEQFKEDLTNALAESLGVLPSAIVLTLEESTETDRQIPTEDYVVVANIEADGYVEKETIKDKINLPTYKNDVNTRVAQKPRLQEAEIAVVEMVSLPVVKFRSEWNLCPFGEYDSYTAIFHNSLPYPVDVIWINFQQEEVVYYSNLAPGAEYPQQTYFTHDWIFKQSGTNNRVFAEANGVKDETYEGCHFGAEGVDSTIRVEIVGSEYEPMEGRGWCVDSEGGEATARKFLKDTTYKFASAMCNADNKCAGFAYAEDTRQAVIYTTNGCTSGCSNTAWSQNPNLIAGADWCCGQTWWRNAVCYRKRTGNLRWGKCPMETGFCVLENGRDQNDGVIKLNDLDGNTPERQEKCLELCKEHDGATGCEVIWDQGNRGCYVHTAEIARGNDVDRHECWVFSKCQEEVEGFCGNLENDLEGTCTQDGDSFTLSARGGLSYENGGMDNDGGGYYAENICLLALYGEGASSYTSKGTFVEASYVVGGGAWSHIHGISNDQLSEVNYFRNMGQFLGRCCFTSWTSLTCTFVEPARLDSHGHICKSEGERCGFDMWPQPDMEGGYGECCEPWSCHFTGDGSQRCSIEAPNPCEGKECGDMCIVGGDMAGMCDGEGQCSFEYNALGCGTARCDIPRNQRICSELFDPRCGSDGNTYSSPCWFAYGQCDNPSLTEIHKGVCLECKNEGDTCGSEPFPPFKDLGQCCEGTRCYESGFGFGTCYSKDPASCEDKECGDMCIMGDIAGMCDGEGKCSIEYDNLGCETGPCDIPPSERACYEIYDPICGSDGKTYSNDCYFGYAQCDNPSLTEDHKGECEGVCRNEGEYCGVDLFPPHKEHGNCCEGTACYHIGRGGSGICSIQDPASCNGKKCGDMCIVGGDMAGACDGNGECSFNYDNLGCEIDICDTPLSERICTREYKPICGSDGVTYSNVCFYEWAKCDNPSLTEAHRGECEEVLVCKCGEPCSINGDMVGVCQADGQTCAINILPPNCDKVCPYGWTQVGKPGADIAGCGMQTCDERYDLTTIEQCAERCNSHDSCIAINWALEGQDQNHVQHKVCTIYDTDVPNRQWGTTQIFCKPSVGDSISYEVEMEGINPENFDTYKDDLTDAFAESLGVNPSTVTLTIEKRNKLDRQDEYVVIATIAFAGVTEKEMIRNKMESSSFKDDINTEIAKRPALQEANIAIQVIEPQGRPKKGDYCIGYLDKPCETGLICEDPNKPGLDVNSCIPNYCKCVEPGRPKKGDYCLGYLDNPCETGLICEDPKKPGLDVNSCTPNLCKCVEADSETSPCDIPLSQRVCPANYDPICGSDGKTYSNICWFHFAQCDNPSLTEAHKGECKEPGPCDIPLSQRMCTKEYSPICGSDGKTYDNVCHFEFGQCDNPSLTEAHKGECPCDIPPSQRMCTKEYSPICGSDGKTYENVCHFEFGQCDNPSLTEAHKGECKDVCKKELDRCGVEPFPPFKDNGKCCEGTICTQYADGGAGTCTREDLATCKGKKCGDMCIISGDIAGACDNRGECTDNYNRLNCEPPGPCDIPTYLRMCTEEYFPICGSDGTTYDNVCFFEFHQCDDPSLTEAHKGECEGVCKNEGDYCGAEPFPPFKEHGHCCEGTTCYHIGLGGAGTCSREDPASCKGKKCGDMCIVGGDMAGACDGRGECSFNYDNLGCEIDICDTPLSERICTKEYFPICGSDGKTYDNVCFYEWAKCDDPSLTEAHRGECEACPAVLGFTEEQGYVSSTWDVLKEESGLDLIHCGERCFEMKACKSFLHNRPENLCKLYGEEISQISDPRKPWRWCIKTECPSGTFNVVRTCVEFGEWCQDQDAKEGCLGCEHCDSLDQESGKCPECLLGEMDIISYEVEVEGINTENFDTLKDDLTDAFAESLGVNPSAVTLTIQKRNKLDRQDEDEYVVIATIAFTSATDKEMITNKMESPTFKDDVNTEIAKKPALQEANIATQGIEPREKEPYFKGPGGKSCPTNQRVVTAEECKVAAATVGYPFNKEVEDATDRPQGCFWDQNGFAYFNKILDATVTWEGVGGICKQPATEVRFAKVDWGTNKMNEVEAGGEGTRVRKDDLELYMALAGSDTRIVAFSMHPDESMATFYTYLEGNTSPVSESWPVYVRSDLIDPSWTVGSHVDIGDNSVVAPAPRD